MKQNVIWCDFEPGQKWSFIDGLNDTTNLNFEKIVFKNNRMGTKTDNIIRYIKYFFFSLSMFRRRKEFNIVVSWQQFYGLLFAFFCRIFHVNKVNQLYVMVFIYIPKKGIIGKIYKKFITYVISSKYIDKIILNSTSEAKKYAKELSVCIDKFEYVPLGEDICETTETVNYKKDFLFSSGYSNRDFDFLVDTLQKTEYETYIFGSKGYEKDNIHMINENVGNRLSDILDKCRIVLVPLKENRESGQLTVLHAMEAGIPVIVTNTDCMKDYVKDGVNGYLCENNPIKWKEKIDLLYYDNKLYFDMAKKCKDCYQNNHTRYAMGKNVGMIIISIINRGHYGK